MNRKVALMLVEDNEDHVLLIRSILKDERISLVEFMDYSTAESYLRESANVIDCMLLDVKLKNRSGIELLRAVRSMPHRSILPVTMLTTSANPVDVVESYNAGANGYIIKAAMYSELESRLKMFLRYWLEVSILPVAIKT